MLSEEAEIGEFAGAELRGAGPGGPGGGGAGGATGGAAGGAVGAACAGRCNSNFNYAAQGQGLELTSGAGRGIVEGCQLREAVLPVGGGCRRLACCCARLHGAFVALRIDRPRAVQSAVRAQGARCSRMHAGPRCAAWRFTLCPSRLTPGWYCAVFDLALSPTGDTLIYQANRNLEHPVTTVHPEPCSLL
jgi:hypothetical protein